MYSMYHHGYCDGCVRQANFYIKNRGGFAPLHLSCQNGHNETSRVLLIHGCKPDIKNNVSVSCVVVVYGSYDVVVVYDSYDVVVVYGSYDVVVVDFKWNSTNQLTNL